MFDAPTTTLRERKQLIRAVISEVGITVCAPQRIADLQIVWQGGATTHLSMPMNKAGGHLRATDEETLALVRRLAQHYDDRTIAVILAKQKRRTATGLTWTRPRVATLRANHAIPAYQPPPAADVRPDCDDAVVVTITAAEKLLGVSKVTLYRWMKDGFITGEQITPGAPWRIRIDQALRDRIRSETPDGWLGLDEAAKALGIARQTVLHKVQRGQLRAVYVNRGRRKGLRIQVEHDQPGLFDTP
ncbi:MAG TPA: helix-turn-helix domain-containing protein [Pseudonocardiaceae bacterium]|nr:helix-turn-helix domain-containing protein [Pseudonocardiaceae bacterium]